ncbi:MAG: peptidyl-prolyl cis-trans isomerase [Gemmatimonadaceae bacterium]|nr:peptidyl-prolyl cis-trans isomerase [Gemmatimonadaceae bacterium]
MRLATAPSSGQYMTIGGVVAEVNSTPIYADKVVAQIAHVLAARAKDISREKFRDVAKVELKAQVQKLVNLELEYAAAQRNLDEADREFAANMTADWRRHKIAEAQGSQELARKRAAEQGIGLEEMVAEQFRFFMSQIYYQKRLVPRIQVSANDMRRYYETRVGSEFTERDTARFRLIKITVKQVGDPAEARKKITEIRQRIVDRGEDFAAIAATTNDPMLARSKGELPPVQRGAFAEAKVDQAVWATPVGDVTQVIETPDAFYLARVEERKNGRTVPFEEEQTQVAIKEKLRAEQFRSMREQVLADLRKDAIIRSTDEMMNTAIEMAMQNYSAWHARS